MKNILLVYIIISLLSCSKDKKVIEFGEKIPNYTFKEVLNIDQKPFEINNQDKPIIIEFWATWCSPCLPAMNKLEDFQRKYGDDIEIITVSTDSKKNLSRYIENTKTSLRVAFDTTHLEMFNYKYIPHTVLIDKQGIVKAITTPVKLTERIINNLVAGKPIEIQETESIASNLNLNKEYKGNDYQFNLTSENKKFSFKNEIKKDKSGNPVSLDFRNVSIYRLMTDIYELSSAARIYSEEEILTTNKYCFKLEQSNNYKKDLLPNAKEILNSNLDLKAEVIEKEMENFYVLEVIDKSKVVKKSKAEKKSIEFRGPYYSGKKITTYNLIEYLENEVQQPIKDKALLNYEFDVELSWSYEDGSSLNRELNKYGFQISESENPEKIKLLKLSENNGN